jgi:hypothetical protein
MRISLTHSKPVGGSPGSVTCTFVLVLSTTFIDYVSLARSNDMQIMSAVDADGLI